MKKIIFVVVLSLVLIFVGCVDVINIVKVDKKGEVIIFFDIDIFFVVGIFVLSYLDEVEVKLKEVGFIVDKKLNISYYIEKKLDKNEIMKSDMKLEDFGVKIINSKSFFI